MSNIKSLDNFTFVNNLLMQIEYDDHIQLLNSLKSLEFFEHSRGSVAKTVVARFESTKVATMLNNLYKDLLGHP